MFFASIFILIALILVGSYFYQANPISARHLLIGGLFCALVTLTMYRILGAPDYSAQVLTAPPSSKATSSDFSSRNPFAHEDPKAKNSLSEYITDMQQAVIDDTENGEKWYALGNAYMYANQFENADVAFSYAQRLAAVPEPNILAARATALYYAEGQRLSLTAEKMLKEALQLDPENTAALMLKASDHFLNAEYRHAILIWQLILDSEKEDIDRVAVITAIHQAQNLCQCSLTN